MEIRELAPDGFPPQLREIPDPPKQLWALGAMPPPENKLLTVVGSRAMSRYGKEAVDHLISGLAGYPISIVSGLALGVDTAAHKAALAAGLHAVAVPGSGLDESVLYPRSNRGFAKDILAAGGALISEEEPREASRIHFFPKRSRIMVGLSDAVLMIEAGEKSGTLITARLASEYNRELLCVPHRIGDPNAFGPHLFIRLGAILVTEPLHILEALKIAPVRGPERNLAPLLEGAESEIWHILAEPKTRDEILRAHSALGPGDLLTALVALELKGLVREEFGTWHRV